MLKGSIPNSPQNVKSYGVNDSAHGGAPPSAAYLAKYDGQQECVTCDFVTDDAGTYICPNCRRWLVRPDRARVARERRALFVPKFDSEPLTQAERFANDDLARELETDQGW